MVNQVSSNPHGKGDPNDLSLRRVEIDVLIPKIMRDRAKQIHCKDVVAKFETCCKSSGIKMVFSCRKETADLKECLTRWYNNEDFRKECKEIYLQERSNYRSTGIPKRETMQRM